MDRSMTCWQCKHLADTKGIDSLHEGSPAKGLCELTVSMEKYLPNT